MNTWLMRWGRLREQIPMGKQGFSTLCLFYPSSFFQSARNRLRSPSNFKPPDYFILRTTPTQPAYICRSTFLDTPKILRLKNLGLLGKFTTPVHEIIDLNLTYMYIRAIKNVHICSIYPLSGWITMSPFRYGLSQGAAVLHSLKRSLDD